MAAVLFGNPDNTEEVNVTGSDRFQMLHGRDVDLLLYGDTHTIEREVHEKSTGSGFTFSSPYYYDGLSYYGDGSFVKCAEQQKRYAECSSLRICTYEGSTGKDFLKSTFPSDFLEVAPSLVQAKGMMRDGKCKVMAANRMSLLLDIESSGDNSGGNFVVGGDLMTKEPYAVVTRNDDTEFSDIINWAVQALFYGEEQGLTKNSSRCQGYADLMGSVPDLDFLNAVYCVGNYAEIFHRYESNRGLNRINNGTTGMLYAIPFGELKREIDQEVDPVDTILHSIRNNGTLDCGIIIPDEYVDGEGTARGNLVDMSTDYCRTVAAALFNGNFESVNLWEFSEGDDDSYLALNNGTVDVLSGARIERKYDFRSSPSLGGFHFSTPYYYGNDTKGDDASFFSFATRDSDVLFSSFVNCVVMATIYAKENEIRKSTKMPMVGLFGSEFTWSLRDAVEYSGSYDKIYEKYFGKDAEEGTRGRNDLNGGGPQMHSFPGLKH